MRLLGLLRVVAFGLLALCSLSGTARADWSISKTPEGQDILAFCRAALNQDKQLQLAWGLRLYPTVEEQDRTLLSEEFFNAWDGLTASNIPSLIQRHENSMRNDPRNWEHAVVCALKRRLYQLQNARTAGNSKPSGRPAAAAKPAPAERLQPGRPAKITAPWSPKSLSTIFEQKLSPQFAAERADALASCQVPMQQWITGSNEVGLTTGSANLDVEGTWLNDSKLRETPQEIHATIGRIDNKLAPGSSSATNPAIFRIFRCLSQRRLAQLDGSPLIAGAVDGSLNPMTIGNPNSSWKPQGKDAKIIASDGKSAMDCVKLETLTKTDSGMSGGGRVISNQCSGAVEITWCYTDTECSNNRGAQWTIGAGRSWPVSAERPIRWAACHGANTVSFVKGSAGLRYYCSAPAKK